MKLVFIHGRAQGEKSETELMKDWGQAFDAGLRKAGLSRPPDLEIDLPFYGKTLDDLTARAAQGLISIIERGEGGIDAKAGEFEALLLRSIANAAEISEDEIEKELPPGVVNRAPQNWEWVQALGRVISRRLPWFAELSISRFTADVDAYTSNQAIRRRINDAIRPQIPDAPCVVLAHSLGSIIGYWLLTEMAEAAKVKLLVTVGCPLGIDVIKHRLPVPIGVPAGVEHWLNAVDERDPIALCSRLDRKTFAAGIENITDLDNPRDHPHGIVGYLSDAAVASRLHAALS